MPVSRTWQDFVNSDSRVRAAEATASNAGRKITARDLRMGYGWRPASDPGEANRAKDKEKGIEPIDYEPIPIRIIPRHNGEVFLNYQGAWIKNKKGQNCQIISNSHNGQRGAYPDLLFAKFVLAGGNPDSIFRADDNSVMKLELLADFHVIEESAGESRFKRKNWKRCAGRGCSYCDRGMPTVFGRIVHWSMFPTMRRLIEKQLLEISTKCANCQKGDLAPAIVTCPGCAAEYVNAYTGVGSDLSDEDYELITNAPLQCSICGHMGKTRTTTYQCIHSSGFGSMRRTHAGCDSPMQYSIENTSFVLSTSKSGKVTTATLTDPSLLDATELPVRTGSQLCPPFDIDELFDTMTISEQASMLDMDNEQIKASLGMSIEELEAELITAKAGAEQTGFTDYE